MLVFLWFFYIRSQNGTLRNLSVLNLKSVSNLTTFLHFYHFYSDLIYHHLMLTLLQKPLTRITAFTLVFQAAFSRHVGQTDLVKTQIRSWRFLAQYSPQKSPSKIKVLWSALQGLPWSGLIFSCPPLCSRCSGHSAGLLSSEQVGRVLTLKPLQWLCLLPESPCLQVSAWLSPHLLQSLSSSDCLGRVFKLLPTPSPQHQSCFLWPTFFFCHLYHFLTCYVNYLYIMFLFIFSLSLLDC